MGIKTWAPTIPPKRDGETLDMSATCPSPVPSGNTQALRNTPGALTKTRRIASYASPAISPRLREAGIVRRDSATKRFCEWSHASKYEGVTAILCYLSQFSFLMLGASKPLAARRSYVLAALLILASPYLQGAETKLIVLIAGTKSHPPGQHEYSKTLKLLKYELEHDPNLPPIRAEVRFDGWPEDPSIFDQASAIVSMTDSDDYLERSGPVSFLSDARIGVIDRAMNRGTGLVTLHSSTFANNIYAAQILQWSGGYFDWQTGQGEGGFYGLPIDTHSRMHSLIRTDQAQVELADSRHPIASGVSRFSIRDEFYYQLRFSQHGVQPILAVPAFSNSPRDQVVAWAFTRPNGGRGGGVTPGHFYVNWRNDDFRKAVLNGIVWASGIAIPAEGVQSQFMGEVEINHAELTRPIATLVLDNNSSTAAQRSVADAIESALNSDSPRFDITRSSDVSDALSHLNNYRLLVLPRCDSVISKLSSRQLHALHQYLSNSGGLLITYSPVADKAPTRNGPTRGICRSPRWMQTEDTAPVPNPPWTKVLIDARIADRAHPSIRGLRDRTITRWETNNPINFVLASDNDMHVLVWNHEIENGSDSPMAFITGGAGGRVFHVVVGNMHPIDVGDNPVFPLLVSNLSTITVDLIRRGGLWAAGE
jgi:type 1 glutamine amidotransferase